MGIEKKLVTLEDLKVVHDECADLKGAIADDVGTNELIVKNVVHADRLQKIDKTINVSAGSYPIVTTDVISASQDEFFIVYAKVTPTNYTDYEYSIRAKKQTESGETGVYYYMNGDSTVFYPAGGLIGSIIPTGSDVTGLKFQLVEKYTGSAESNYPEIFNVDCFVVIRGKISLYGDALADNVNVIEQKMQVLFPPALSIEDLEWESGYYTANGTPAGTGSDKYLRTVTTDFIQCANGSSITLKSIADNQRVAFCRYYAPNEASIIDRIVRVKAGTQTFDIDCYVRMYVYYNDTRVITDQSALIDNVGLNAIQTGYATLGALDAVNTRIDNLSNEISALPSDWAAKVQAVQTAQKDNFIFAIQTDTHYYNGYGNDAGENLKLLTNYVGFDFVANLGDLTRGYADETIDSDVNMRIAMTEIMRRYVSSISCPFMITMGNHESNGMWAETYGGERFTNAELWGRMFRPAFNTNTNAVTETGLMYYYTDFENVRVIVLNTQDGANQGFGIGSTQLSWFTNTALNTDKAVLVMSHVPLVNGWSVQSNYDSSFAGIVNALQAFKTNGGTVIGCMSGHIHSQESKTVDGLLYIAFKNGGNNAEVVVVDLENKAINTIGIGVTNRTFTFT